MSAPHSPGGVSIVSDSRSVATTILAPAECALSTSDYGKRQPTSIHDGGWDLSGFPMEMRALIAECIVNATLPQLLLRVHVTGLCDDTDISRQTTLCHEEPRSWLLLLRVRLAVASTMLTL